MSHVAETHFGNCPALKGFAGRGREMGIGEEGIYVSVTGAIYEETHSPPFFQREGVICLPQEKNKKTKKKAAVQILAVLVHLLPL